jgi:hypothetical protein
MKEHIRSRNWMHNVNAQKEEYFDGLADQSEHVRAGRVNPAVNRRRVGRV